VVVVNQLGAQRKRLAELTVRQRDERLLRIPRTG